MRDADCQFLFTFDEDGYPTNDEVVSEYQFGYGAAHFFGQLEPSGQVIEVVAGATEILESI